ncbi:MAG: hypothetical protein WA746_11210 [Isosphaeraceae bacterium]
MRFARIVPQVLVAWPPHIIPILGHRSQGAIPTRRLIALAAAFTALLAAAAVAQPPASDPPKKVVIPFDFETKFDNGEYGQTIGDMLWAKLHRQGGFVIPESKQDVRDWCQRTHMIPGPETTLEKMKEVVAREQSGDIGIWGKIERVQGFETDVYDLWINVADFSVDPPRWIYQKKARTQTVSQIPHIYVKEALDRLYGRTEQIAGAPDPELQKRWEKAPNLVKGDFEYGHSAPAGWDPLPHDITWVVVKGKDAKAGNRIIRFTMNEDVAGSTGVLYYSNFFPVEEGATYRFQCRWRTTGSAAKVFIKCYDELPTSFRTREGGDSLKTEKREVYRSQQNLQGSAGAWNVQTEDFTPQHTQFTPRWGRVMLYAYWPAGSVEWDDVVVKQIAPAPPRKREKDRRPSTETKVRTREMQEDPAAPAQPAPARKKPGAQGPRGSSGPD